MIRVKRISSFLLLLFLMLILPVQHVHALERVAHDSNSLEAAWYGKDSYGQPVIHLYFFWSKKCPHCLKAQPDMANMAIEYPWLKIHSLELSQHPENVQTFINMSEIFGNDARSVPSFMFCGNLLSGYEDRDTSGRLIRSYLQACYQFAKETNPDNAMAFTMDQSEAASIDIPFLGEVSSEGYSLPMLTVFIAGMDAFNPCAFFVLLFLLSMMVHTRSRSRMALIGGIFVFFSGAIYFLFMAAWLNLFIYLGELRVITLIAGCIAVIMASINIKDYVWFKQGGSKQEYSKQGISKQSRFKQGVSLSIPDSEKPKLFDRIRQLLRLDSVITVIFATVLLAIVANSYELLCTAGFPMVYTRILTLKSLSAESYYLYLLLYNLVYILPLLTIVVVFTIKLGSRKLSEQEGMVLKLLSGVMMFLLGLILVVSPQLLNNVVVAAMILVIAISVTWLITKLTNNSVE